MTTRNNNRPYQPTWRTKRRGMAAADPLIKNKQQHTKHNNSLAMARSKHRSVLRMQHSGTPYQNTHSKDTQYKYLQHTRCTIRIHATIDKYHTAVYPTNHGLTDITKQGPQGENDTANYNTNTMQKISKTLGEDQIPGTTKNALRVSNKRVFDSWGFQKATFQ